jgi:hypothetical protein
MPLRAHYDGACNVPRICGVQPGSRGPDTLINRVKPLVQVSAILPLVLVAYQLNIMTENLHETGLVLEKDNTVRNQRE